MNLNLLEINIKNLYAGDKLILKNFKLNISDNKNITIIGKTGVGKSTLLKTLNLLNLKYEGYILYKNKNILQYRPEELRSKIIMVIQETPLYGDTVLDDITNIFKFKINHNKKFNMDKLKQLLKIFLLPETILNANPLNLSGGEKQRISLIKALLIEPEVLLLDEPSSALDKNTEKIISEYLLNIPIPKFIISHSKIFTEKAEILIELLENQTYNLIKK